MKIGKKLIIGFMVIASLVGFVGIFSVISHNNIQTNSKIITKVLELDILLDESLVELLALNQTENIKDYVREKSDYEQIRAELDALDKKLHEENEKELQALRFNIEVFRKDSDQLAMISNRLIALHKRYLAKIKAFNEKQSLEQQLRHKIRAALFELQDNALTRDVEQMQYKSKEALYQYKDQKHGVEWLDSISKVKDNSLIVPSQDISKDLNAYERVAQDLSKIIVEQKTIETQEYIAFGELKELINRLEENQAGIVNKIKAESQALAMNTHLTMLAVIMGAFLVSIILGLTIARSISKPVANLAQTTQAIAQGDFSLRVDIATDNEIGELATSFNDMAGKLKESHTQLEERVSERTAELSSANVELEGEIEQRTSAQKTLEERIKELNCLFGLSKLVERSEISLEQIFEETASLIRKAYQEPDKICVRVTFEGVQYKTDNFAKSESSQHAEIKLRGEKAGGIEVYYLGEKAENGQSAFLKEESDLLDAVAKHLGSVAERTHTREKLQLFRDLIDRSNDCIFIKEPKWGRFLDVNEKACESLGYTREELLNMSVKDIDETIPDDSAWTEHVKEVREKGYMIFESVHKRKDGTAFPVEINIKFIEQEKDSYILAVARDITERKKAEEALEKSEARYRSLTDDVLDSSAVGIFILDSDFKIVWVNQALERFFGVRRKDVIGKDKRELIRKRFKDIFEDSETFVEKVFATYENNTYIENFECHVLGRGEREERWLEHWSQPIRTGLYKGGRIEHYTNITERKKAEEEREKLLEKVESINKELKDFAYIVSHDLKAPLRGIRTLSDWITTDYSDKLDDNGKEQISLLGSRVDRMHNLIDGVLEYSRVGRKKEKQVQVNLNDLVSGIIDAIAPPENIAITVDDELPVVKCGQTRIMQVFQNLLSNAVKYMDKPKGKIKVGCVEENGFWKFSVADNGPGIEEKDFERIFKIFQTLSPRDEVESTGVGLTVVKKIVEMYGGKIWVESKSGQGSTFFFTLPKQKMGVKNAKFETNIVS